MLVKIAQRKINPVKYLQDWPPGSYYTPSRRETGDRGIAVRSIITHLPFIRHALRLS